MSKKAIIIGAGLGGMSTAIRLARDGWEVKVLEKNVRVGGKLSCHSEGGFIWDVGPSLITMPFVLRELFEYAGHDLEDYLELMTVDPVCRYFYPDGKVINAWANPHLFQIEVARCEKDHGEALEKFMRYGAGIHDLSAEAYLYHPPNTKLGYLGWRFLKNIQHVPKVAAGKSMSKVIESFFKSPHIRQLFQRYATYTGSSPYNLPSTFNIIPYLELKEGGWYIRGGLYRLAEALEKCARDLGVEFLVDAEVNEIVCKENGVLRKPTAVGVMVGGVRMEADAIICNADVSHAWSRLLPIKRQKTALRFLQKRPYSSSPFMLMLGVKKRYEQLAHHNVFFSSDYLAEFDDIFKKKRPPQEPTIYVSITSRSDPTQAPPGQDNYFVLVNTPALEPDHHWDTNRESYRDLILERLEKAGLTGLKQEILCEKIVTPADFAERTRTYRGAIYGHATHSIRAVGERPSNRSELVKNLYFVGGSAKPGGGIPLVLLSAQRVVQAVKTDLE